MQPKKILTPADKFLLKLSSIWQCLFNNVFIYTEVLINLYFVHILSVHIKSILAVVINCEDTLPALICVSWRMITEWKNTIVHTLIWDLEDRLSLCRGIVCCKKIQIHTVVRHFLLHWKWNYGEKSWGYLTVGSLFNQQVQSQVLKSNNLSCTCSICLIYLAVY